MYSANASYKEKAEAIEFLKKHRPVFEKDVLDKNECEQALKALEKEVAESVDKMEIVKDSLAFTFATTLGSEIKKYFNAQLLERYEDFHAKIQNADDQLKLAIQYAMIGNYIDFGAMKEVEEDKLNELLEQAKEINLDEQEFENLRREILTKKTMVYLTDNCGEIVFDKLLINMIKKINSD